MAYVKQNAEPTESVTAAQLLEFLGLPADFPQANTIASMIAGAREQGEILTGGRALASRAFTHALDAFPSDRLIKLGYSPVTAVASITYTKPDGTDATLTVDTDYTLDLLSEPARIQLHRIPATRDIVNAVRVVFTAGYTQSTLPESLRLGILNLAAYWFQNRGATHSSAAIGKGFDVPPYIEKIFTSQQILDFAPTR